MTIASLKADAKAASSVFINCLHAAFVPKDPFHVNQHVHPGDIQLQRKERTDRESVREVFVVSSPFMPCSFENKSTITGPACKKRDVESVQSPPVRRNCARRTAPRVSRVEVGCHFAENSFSVRWKLCVRLVGISRRAGGWRWCAWCHGVNIFSHVAPIILATSRAFSAGGDCTGNLQKLHNLGTRIFFLHGPRHLSAASIRDPPVSFRFIARRPIWPPFHGFSAASCGETDYSACDFQTIFNRCILPRGFCVFVCTSVPVGLIRFARLRSEKKRRETKRERIGIKTDVQY